MVNTDRLMEILEMAEALVTEAERERYLDVACAGEPELKEQIISLLQSHESAGDFLKGSAIPPLTLAEEPGTLIGRYRILEKLGEGGCGDVYVAEQKEPVRRRVALKVIKAGMDTKQVLARFEAERQALAMMDHANIARVLDAGSTETGRPYFIMELVRGVRITQFCNENKLSTRERLDLFIKVCLAIQHAHQKGIIHRDIKPSNILVTLHDSVAVPKVIDFGIAKAIEGRLAEATVYTHLLQFVGTPAYMSPEQAEMSGLDIDTRSDIYSLGVLLYELLTGQTPFDGQKLISSGIDEMRKTIREKEPLRPSTKLRHIHAGNASAIPNQPISNPSMRSPRSAIDNDLDWIVMKCLEKDRARRYETATGLAADLQRHLRNEPVEARPASAAYKLQKAWQRNRLAFSSAGAVAIALLLGIAVSTWQAFEASNARKAAEVEKTTAQHQLYVANMFSAGQAWEERNYQLVRQLLADTSASSNRNFEWYYWQGQTHLNVMTLYGHHDTVKSIAFFPDGQRIVTSSEDKTARVWDMVTGKELLKLSGHKSSVNCVVVSPNGKQIATASSEGTVKVWDSSSGRELLTLPGRFGPIHSLAFSRDGRRIVTGGNDGIGRIWDVATRRVIVTLKGHTGWITSVAYSPDGEKIVTASNDRTAEVWRSADGQRLLSLNGTTREIMTVAFAPDGQVIVTGSLDQVGQYWDAQTGEKMPFQLVTKEPMVTLAFSKDGRRIVTGSWDSTARVWNASNRHTELLIQGHVRGLQAVAISP
ncbi:MAG TPA: serine/threonine-protein kinase, partial [Verrucomicrobiae bacterium]|nr:serine/threonine-protein kinase [Verrucomicrobiae bacterium]